MPHKAPLVTILINNYNYGRYLREAIDSALAQTWTRREIIVVDDGSTDDSREIIHGYGNSIVPVLKENGGQASAFNEGFAASRGDIVCFLDADDVFLPRKLERIVQAWYRSPDAGLIYHQLQFINENGRRVGRSWPSSVLRGWLKARVERSGGWWPLPTTSGLACSRAYLGRILPMPCAPYRLCADAYIGGLAPFLTAILGIREPLAMYRLHSANNHNTSVASDVEVRRRMHRYEVEFQELRRALPRLATAGSAISLEDHFPYQWCCWKAGGSASKWKVLATALRTPSMPFAMKCKALLKTVMSSRMP
jgi:glycosyltransferase involved in cell wall biosynthesis